MYRIFIVEDDEIIAKTVKSHLEKWNYTVHCVENFNDVMAEFAAFDPQLVLMDIHLPFITGITGVRRSVRYRSCRSSFYHRCRMI